MTTPDKRGTGSVEWSRRYQSALCRYLKTETAAGLQAAQRLGRQAVSLGMETLDVAHLHEQVLSTLATAGGTLWGSPGAINRAKAFFTEVIVPIEQTHDPALKAGARVTKLTRSLRQRTKEATDSTRQLEKGVIRRQAAEAALRESVLTRAGLLAEALRLRQHLQHLTHEIISAQEEERKAFGTRLRDDIAQFLLATQIRLMALNGAVLANSKNLKMEIAETRRIVKQSISIIHRLSPQGQVLP